MSRKCQSPWGLLQFGCPRQSPGGFRHTSSLAPLCFSADLQPSAASLGVPVPNKSPVQGGCEFYSIIAGRWPCLTANVCHVALRRLNPFAPEVVKPRMLARFQPQASSPCRRSREAALNGDTGPLKRLPPQCAFRRDSCPRDLFGNSVFCPPAPVAHQGLLSVSRIKALTLQIMRAPIIERRAVLNRLAEPGLGNSRLRLLAPDSVLHLLLGSLSSVHLPWTSEGGSCRFPSTRCLLFSAAAQASPAFLQGHSACDVSSGVAAIGRSGGTSEALGPTRRKRVRLCKAEVGDSEAEAAAGASCAMAALTGCLKPAACLVGVRACGCRSLSGKLVVSSMSTDVSEMANLHLWPCSLLGFSPQAASDVLLSAILTLYRKYELQFATLGAFQPDMVW